jgi:capsule polysaccharide export protein KpsE/RkpR
MHSPHSIDATTLQKAGLSQLGRALASTEKKAITATKQKKYLFIISPPRKKIYQGIDP